MRELKVFRPLVARDSAGRALPHIKLPPEPRMRVVTKGLWFDREEKVSREELVRRDNAER